MPSYRPIFTSLILLVLCFGCENTFESWPLSGNATQADHQDRPHGDADCPPIAEAGPDQIVNDLDRTGGESVQLDASQSTDDRGIVAYTWREGETEIASGASATVFLTIGVHTITLEVTDTNGQISSDTITVTVVRAPGAWTPPIGIPQPPFGIFEKHTMYTSQAFDFGNGPEPYRDAGNGPYTHYVDNTHPQATDAENPFGTPEKPRMSLPSYAPAGSVIEIHGGPYPYTTIPYFHASGTQARPVFMRGIGQPRLEAHLSIYTGDHLPTSFLIIENMDAYKFDIVAPTDHLVVRNCDVHGDVDSGGFNIWTQLPGTENKLTLIFQNKIHDNGNWLSELDQDVHGIGITGEGHDIWILENEFYHNSGDGAQINAGSLTAMPFLHHIYLGRNVSHHNKQSGLWAKQAVDVIFSENTIYGAHPIGQDPSAWGSGLGFQYGPERVWFLYNHVYDCSYGISSGSTSGMGFGENAYAIGNLIHDIHHDQHYPYNPLDTWSNAAISFVGTTNKYIINNTIHNVDAGINAPSNGRYVIVNNIISNITEPSANHVYIDGATVEAPQDSIFSYNLLYQNGDPPRIRWGGMGFFTDLTTFQNTTQKGEGCVVGDPLFANPALGDFHLNAASPAVDAAGVSDVYDEFYQRYGLRIDVDRDAKQRPALPTLWDIGAYER